MKNTLSLTKRNLLLFFRNKSEVFFSFLSVIIILGLYVLFLSDLQVLNIENEVGKIAGVKALVNSWVMAGLIAVSTVTLSLGALGRMVADRQNNSLNDFLVAPVKREQIFLSYILSALIITMILSIMLIAIAQIYISSSGGQILSLIGILEVLGITFLCTLSSSLLMLFIISFIRNEQSYSLVSTIVGTLIGFVTGAYIPIGIL
ncbi:MAG: ABC transporter permease, partial [Bacilli bacterium]